VLPVLTYVAPDTVADALRWRHSCLNQAREHAAGLGLAGAAFPWRTIDGQENSAYWPAGTAAFHVSADIAGAAERYLAATRDEEFASGIALELAVETARMWMSMADDDGRFELNGVTGPDEYSAIADNNIYTNLMVRRNLRFADRLCSVRSRAAARLNVTTHERQAWRSAADRIVIPFDQARGLHPQSERFLEHGRLDFNALHAADYPLMLTMPYFRLYSTQVVKQADLVLAMWLCGEEFTTEQKQRNFDFYESITVRDSSLSSGIQAILAAEVGHLQLAHDHLAEAALIDLQDRQHNTRDGLHLASLASAWLGLVAGFGGLREHEGLPCFDPHLPPALSRIRFHLRVADMLLAVTITHDHARYELLEGTQLTIAHNDDLLKLTVGAAVQRPLSPQPTLPEPSHPLGRRPRHRRATRPARGRTDGDRVSA
jgi:alpha,alpha-trehalose phosphorylase